MVMKWQRKRKIGTFPNVVVLNKHVLKKKLFTKKKKFCWKCSTLQPSKMYSRWICFLIRRDLEKCSITSLAHQWITIIHKYSTRLEGFFTGDFFFVVNNGLNNWFVVYKHAALHLTRFYFMDWSHVEYCDVFYQLFGLSFWRHPFTAEDLLMSKWCNAKFLHIFFTWRSKVILSGKKVSKFSEKF